MVDLNDNQSQLMHLEEEGGGWPYSVRKNLSVLQNCHDERGEREISLTGMGRVPLQEECSFKLEDWEFTSPVSL